MLRQIRNRWLRFTGLTARIDKGKVYFSSKELHKAIKADIKAGLCNVVIRDNGWVIMCPSGDKVVRRYRGVWVIEDA